MTCSVRTQSDGVRALQYGSSDQQTVEFLIPANAGRPRGTAVLIHGGYWRARFDATLMTPLAKDLTARGWAVANIEYRRVGNGGGWPATLDDVQAALRTVRSATPPDWTGLPVVGIGHSVGGQLALLAAEELDAVVALAPITDVARADREGLGEDAAREFMGSASTDALREYAQASPIRQLPIGCPVLVIHGDTDARVPVEHSHDFTAAAEAAGDNIDFRVFPGLGHLEAIDPEAAHWPGAVAWMHGLMPKTASNSQTFGRIRGR